MWPRGDAQSCPTQCGCVQPVWKGKGGNPWECVHENSPVPGGVTELPVQGGHLPRMGQEATDHPSQKEGALTKQLKKHWWYM